MAYLCLIPMQYGVKSCSWNLHDSACLDKNFGEPVQWDVTVTKPLQTERWTVCKYTCPRDIFLFYPLWFSQNGLPCFILQVLILLCQWKKYFIISIHVVNCCYLAAPKKVPLWDFFCLFWVFFCNALLCSVLSSMFVICFTLVLKAQSLNFILNHSIY